MTRIALAASTALFGTLAAFPAYAQAETGGIEDIVVTAQRRAERAQDVPIAISAFSADQLQAQGVSSTVQIGNVVPNLISQSNTGIGSANAYFLRGLGSTESIATFDPPVGTYVDDIYLSRQNANNLSMFDVERVEVLRGPQGTLFGRNTTGGAVNVIMRQPGDEFAGYAEAGYGRYNRKLLRASFDAPLAPGLAVKLSGYWQDDDGYAKNVTTGERLNDDDGWGVRLGIRGELSPSIRWTGSFMHIVTKADNLPNFECNPANPTECDGRYITTGLRTPSGLNQFAPIAVTGDKANFGLGQTATTSLVTSNLAFDFAEDHTLTLITGFLDLNQRYVYDFFDGRSGPSLAVPRPPVRGYARGGFTVANDGSHNQFTQEIKLNGSFGNGFVEYVAGAFYLDERNTTDFADLFTIAPPVTLLLADRTLKNRTEAKAGYAQVDLNLTSQLKLTAGIRYTDETKTLSVLDNRAICNAGGALPANCLDNSNLIGPSGVRIPTSLNTRVWTPRFAANFKPADNILLYASATKGFRSGGWNARATAPSQFLPFDPEKVWSYEAGIKSDLFDRRVRANVTAFLIDMRNQQVLAGLLNPTTGAITFLTRNFADFRNKGLEAEFTFAPVDGLNLYANLGYQDAEHRLLKNAPATDIYGIQSVESQLAECKAALATGQIPAGTTGNTYPRISTCASGIVTANGTIAKPTRTPNWTLQAGASYEIAMGELSLVPSANVSWHSAHEVALSNLSFYDQPIAGTNGAYPSNPFGNGELITGAHAKAAAITNASLTLNGPDKRWALSLDCSNCFNVASPQTSLSNVTYISRPMSWMMRGRYKF